MRLVESKANGYYCPDDQNEPFRNGKRLSVSDVEARVLSEFSCGKDVLEIGTGLGVSTREIAKNAKWVHTVDIDDWVRDNVELPENCTFYEDINLLPDNFADMAFVDGSHIEEHVIEDAEHCRRIVKPGGLLLFHDCNITSVHNGIYESGLVMFIFNIGTGIGVGWNE